MRDLLEQMVTDIVGTGTFFKVVSSLCGPFFLLIFFCFVGVHQYPFLHARAFSIVAKFSSVVGILLCF